MKDALVGFGELLLRLDTPGNSRFSQLDTLQAKFTGGEVNVLVAARRFGVESCSIASCVPENALGDACLDFLNRYGVETQKVFRCDGRLGILFVETGASVRPTRVIYDREHTGFRTALPHCYDWQSILQNARVLHITGTAPALGPQVNQAIEDAMDVARQLGCLISFDCSYRSSLWSIEEAGEAYRRIASRVDVLFASPGDAEIFFGIKCKGESDRMLSLMETYNLLQVAYTDRTELSVSRNQLVGTFLFDNKTVRSRMYEFEVVDRIGSGDAFAGGVLASLMQGKSPQDTVEFATAAAVLKHTVHGDFCLVSSSEVNELVEGHSLRVRR